MIENKKCISENKNVENIENTKLNDNIENKNVENIENTKLNDNIENKNVENIESVESKNIENAKLENNKLENNKKNEKKKYMNNYYKQNKNKWLGKITCVLCDKKVTRAGKNKHYDSLKHKFKVLQNRLKNSN